MYFFYLKKDLLNCDNENIKIKFDFVRKDIEIRLESLKSELESLAQQANEKLNEIESQYKK